MAYSTLLLATFVSFVVLSSVLRAVALSACLTKVFSLSLLLVRLTRKFYVMGPRPGTTYHLNYGLVVYGFRLFLRTLASAFLSHLKTAHFSRTGLGSSSEQVS